MIACLKGELFRKEPNRAIIDVGGVGYEVFLSLTSGERLPGVGSEVFVHIHTSVREDAITLYGFWEQEEKEMFLLLTSVSGIGPKLALNILSGITATGLGRAISARDLKRLTALSGVGKKTAARLCVELKDKVGFAIGDDDISFLDGGDPAAAPESTVSSDVISGLINLGYPPARAQQALAAVRHRIPPEELAGMRVEQLLRETLRSLA
ncbi:MAG: Holliday junction branch migration protein RuvA [Desulfobacterales bacterium]|nr:Holliday junction branch migration protein RuvA [Desulfobacterales bacterium]